MQNFLFDPCSNDITTNERMELVQHEQVIESGLKTFVDVGTSLLAIRDGRLYRDKYSTFEDYCRERWGFTDRRARMLMASAEVIENLKAGTMVPVLPTTERQARPLARLEPEEQAEVWQAVVESTPAEAITAKVVQAAVDEYRQVEKRPVSYHVSDDSYEWYTPREYIEAARGVMGSIDLDPASSDEAQKTVMAETYFTKEENGLLQDWCGNVWLNPPYNMPLIEQFIDRAISGYRTGAIKSAIILTNNSTDTTWFHKLISYPVCFTRGRIRFYSGEETLSTRQGQAIFYLGDNLDLFSSVFSAFGAIMVRYDDK